jgi:hypothetical protein
MSSAVNGGSTCTDQSETTVACVQSNVPDAARVDGKVAATKKNRVKKEKIK